MGAIWQHSYQDWLPYLLIAPRSDIRCALHEPQQHSLD